MNRLKQTLLVALLIFVFGKVCAQNTKADSLETLLKLHTADDTAKVNLLNRIAFLVYKKDADRANSYAAKAGELSDKINFSAGKAESLWIAGLTLSYYNSNKLALDYYLKAIKIAEEINFKPGLVKYYGNAGVNYATTGNIEAAKEYYTKAMKIAEELNDKLSIARLIGRMCVIHTGLGDYDKAMEGYQEVIAICNAVKNTDILSSALNNMGDIQTYMGNYSKALEYHHQSLRIKEQTDDRVGIIYSYANIGAIMVTQANYKEALEYFNKALVIAKELNDKRRLTLCYENIGDVYMKTNNPKALEYLQNALAIGEELSYTTSMLDVSRKIGDYYRMHGIYAKSLEYYQKALALAEEMSRKRVICEIWYKIGSIHLSQQEYSKALDYTLNSLAIANEMKLLSFQRDIHQQLSEIYSSTNNFAKAYKSYKFYKELNDSVYKADNVKRIIELEYIYKSEKEKQAIMLEQQKKDAIQAAEKKQHQIIIFALLGGLILISLFAVYVYRSYRAKSQTNIMLTKQKREIEELNEEYLALNEELVQSNEQLHLTKELVEESEEKLRVLIKNSNDIFVLVNEKGEQFFISDIAKNLTGYNTDELLGPIGDVIHPDDREIVIQHWKSVLSNKNIPNVVQYRHKHKDKGYIWLEAVAQNFIDNPAINAVVANLRDITERKRIEQALKESEEAKAKLLLQEMERVSRELESNQKSMTAATLKLIQNSERDAQAIEQLAAVEKNTNSEGKRIINALIADYKRVSYSSNWEEFEILFEKVHSSFYETLNAQFPSLTPNERKMCAFLKLNMSSKDIAQITFQSEDALKKARLRLRQKLGLDRETNLVTFIQSI